MFLHDCWYVAGWSHHFPEGRPVARAMLSQPIVLYRQAEGGIAALEDRCCHRLAPLSKGRVEGDDLRCMYHGLKFAPSGTCVEIPGQSIVPPQARVRAYPAVERDSWVWLWMGDPALADTALIPHALKHDDPDWWMQTGELEYEANYQYINDNLLDLSHLAYVHENTLGRNSMAFASNKPEVMRIDRGLRISRWVVNIPAPKYFDQPQGMMTDMWTSYDYMAAGMFLLQTRSYDVGTAASCGLRKPTAKPLWTTLTSQAVTPIDDRHTVYYYSGCLEKSFATEAQSLAQFDVFEHAFAEDRAMIEAQQQVIWKTPEPHMLGTSSDHALNQFRRLMDELIDAEGRAARASNVAVVRVPAQA